jgi:hypothetical protein
MTKNDDMYKDIHTNIYIFCLPQITLKMEIEGILEKLAIDATMTRLIARENFVT